MSFTQQLETGLAGESLIAKWLNRKGWRILPAYEIELNHGKGPRLFASCGQLISPDLLIFNAQCNFKWIEAKTKTAFTWHRQSCSWQTGLDRRHWRDYLAVQSLSPFPVWILFLHKPNGCAKDTPNGFLSPSGLFGNTISCLQKNIHHEHDNHGPSGMVYWKIDALRKIASYYEIDENCEPDFFRRLDPHKDTVVSPDKSS